MKKIKWEKVNQRPIKTRKKAKKEANSYRKKGYYARIQKTNKSGEYNVYCGVGVKRKNKVRD